MQQTIKNQIFEAFDDVIEIPEGFIDTTWRNNACPSMAIEIDINTAITIWIDYKNPDLRQCAGKQFIVSMETIDDQFIDHGQFDTLEEALEKAYILKNGYTN
jgi:hypothetical protein